MYATFPIGISSYQMHICISAETTHMYLFALYGGVQIAVLLRCYNRTCMIDECKHQACNKQGSKSTKMYWQYDVICRFVSLCSTVLISLYYNNLPHHKLNNTLCYYTPYTCAKRNMQCYQQHQLPTTTVYLPICYAYYCH
jgi:hypothetical protein